MISSSLVACILLLPRYTLPSRRTIMRSSLPAMYETAKEKLLIQISQIKTCAITTDFWTSASSESYITVTCHFLTSTWELDSHILNTYQVKMQHTGDNIAAELFIPPRISKFEIRGGINRPHPQSIMETELEKVDKLVSIGWGRGRGYVTVQREHYLRDDISCHYQACPVCNNSSSSASEFFFVRF